MQEIIFLTGSLNFSLLDINIKSAEFFHTMQTAPFSKAKLFFIRKKTRRLVCLIEKTVLFFVFLF